MMQTRAAVSENIYSAKLKISARYVNWISDAAVKISEDAERPASRRTLNFMSMMPLEIIDLFMVLRDIRSNLITEVVVDFL